MQKLYQLNDRLRSSYSDQRLGTRDERRRLLEERVGRIRPMSRLSEKNLQEVLGGRPLVGVDGSPNSVGGEFPHYVDFLRALAKSSTGASIVLKDIHCPLQNQGNQDDETALRQDYEVRQKKLANLEVQAANNAIETFRPAIILMDGPLVRFDMRTRESFTILRESVIRSNILLAGCIENIESRVLCSVLGENTPDGWRYAYDRDLLWGVLDYGEVLEVGRPAKGTQRPDTDSPVGAAIRTWFMRSSYDPGVVGVDMLEEQVQSMGPIMDYLFSLSPADGRGIPIWIDLVDREVRLTSVEMEAYLELLDPHLRRFFTSKRSARFF